MSWKHGVSPSMVHLYLRKKLSLEKGKCLSNVWDSFSRQIKFWVQAKILFIWEFPCNLFFTLAQKGCLKKHWGGSLDQYMITILWTMTYVLSGKATFDTITSFPAICFKWIHDLILGWFKKHSVVTTYNILVHHASLPHPHHTHKKCYRTECWR